MKKVKKTAADKTAVLTGALYVIAAVIAVIFVYMVIVNVLYIKNYLATYGMTFSDMWIDSTQYVITGSISYFVYAVLVFCAGRIISMLNRGTAADGKDDEIVDELVGEQACEADPEESEQTEETDIPESEDAIETTEVVEEPEAQSDAESRASEQEDDSEAEKSEK